MARDYASEYARRSAKSQEMGFSSYAERRRIQGLVRHAQTGATTPGTRAHARRRVHEAVAVGEEELDDWQHAAFGSSRVDRARYSNSRRELDVHWTNAPSGVPYPPYIYDAVDPAVWQAFQTSGSPGRFVNHVLNGYPYRPAPEIMSAF